MSDKLIRDYYRCFNERRFEEAGTLFAADAVVEMPPFVQRAHGSQAYTQFTETWLRAFPDAVLTVERAEQRNQTMCEVDLIATGTHSGVLDLGGLGQLRPSGVQLTLRFRELLEIRDGRITYASISFDINGLVRQLNRIDYERLTRCLDAIRQLADKLADAHSDSDRRQDLTERLGQALDEARLVVRPQFRR
jgi:predicted ester cyclase